MTKLDTEYANSEKAVREAVEEFSRAFLEADISALETLLTDDYIHVNGSSGSVLNRDAWLKWMKSRRTELDSGQLLINEYRVEDVTVKVYEDVAIVTGVVHSSGTRQGEAFASQVRFTNTWVLFDGTWRRVSFHDSPLKG